MTTSGTYTFNPALGEITLYAFDLIGIRPAALLAEHMQSARMATNMMLGRWSSQGVNLWAVDLVTTPLVQGTSTYAVDASTIVILDMYVVVNGIDRIITPVSRTEYASYPNKATEGMPTVGWFDRLLSPTITIWPVPDGNQTSLKYYRVRQIQDANFTSGQNVEIPYYFLEAFAQGLAYRLAMIWAPEKAQLLKMVADESYQIAASQNVETAQQYISPMLAGYWR